MKLFKSVLLLVIFAPTVAGQETNFFLQIINIIIGFVLGPYISLVAPGICQTGLETLNLDEVFDCQCTGAYKDFSIVASVACGVQEGATPCLIPPNTLCGDTSLATTFTASGAGLAGSLGACIDIQTGLPLNLDVPELCVDAVAPVGLGFTSCTAKLGGTPCNSCTICDAAKDGGYFKFDCSNIDIIPGIFKLPPLETCLGFGFTASA